MFSLAETVDRLTNQTSGHTDRQTDRPEDTYKTSQQIIIIISIVTIILSQMLVKTEDNSICVMLTFSVDLVTSYCRIYGYLAAMLAARIGLQLVFELEHSLWNLLNVPGMFCTPYHCMWGRNQNRPLLP